MSLLSDLLLRRAIRRISSGVVVSTRPSLHLALTAYARPEVTTVGWEHLNFPARSKNRRLMGVLRAAVPRLDGYVVLTAADAEDYRRELPGLRTEIEVIRNSVPWQRRPAPAAGRPERRGRPAPPLRSHPASGASRSSPPRARARRGSPRAAGTC